MANGEINPYLKEVFALTNVFATPFAQKLANDTMSDPAKEKAVLNERLRIAGLNGSGPNDASAASRAPQGILDLITGRGVAGETAGTGSGLGLLIPLVLIGIVVFIVFKLLK